MASACSGKSCVLVSLAKKVAMIELKPCVSGPFQFIHESPLKSRGSVCIILEPNKCGGFWICIVRRGVITFENRLCCRQSL